MMPTTKPATRPALSVKEPDSMGTLDPVAPGGVMVTVCCVPRIVVIDIIGVGAGLFPGASVGSGAYENRKR